MGPNHPQAVHANICTIQGRRSNHLSSSIQDILGIHPQKDGGKGMAKFQKRAKK
jgi:hypothetical protein